MKKHHQKLYLYYISCQVPSSQSKCHERESEKKKKRKGKSLSMEEIFDSVSCIENF